MGKKNIHIVMCSDLNISNGGCETWLSYFLPELSRRLEYKKIYVYHVNNYCESLHIKKNEIEYISRPNKTNGIFNVVLFTWFVIRKMLKTAQNEDDIVLIGSTFIAPIGILCRVLSLKKKLHINTWIRSIAVKELEARSPRTAFLAKYMENVLLHLSNKVILNGNDTYEYYSKKFNIVSKSVVIENAVPDGTLFNIPIKDDYSKIKVAYMGRYCTAKGFDKYVESVKKYDVVDSDLEFHAYGFGELEETLKESSIKNHGRYKSTDVINILKSVDAVVFLNRTGIAGGLSHSLLECMASGKIIIAWDNNIHNQICDEKNAILIKDGSLQSLISSYKELEKKMLIKDKALNAREKASQYTVEKHVDKFISNIRDVE